MSEGRRKRRREVDSSVPVSSAEREREPQMSRAETFALACGGADLRHNFKFLLANALDNFTKQTRVS